MPQSTVTMHSGALRRGYIFTKQLGMTSYTTSTEYEPRPFDSARSEVSTILDCLNYAAFGRRWSNIFPKIIIKSKALGICDAC